MIHYHGAPCSGPADAAARFWSGRHAFVSFAEPGQLEIIAGACQSFAIDNGAFSAWKGGAALDIHEYRAFVEKWSKHPACDWHVIPDIIDGSEDENHELVKHWEEPNGAPVWHLHESLDYLGYLVGSFPRVAFGSSGEYASVGTAAWWSRMAEAMSVACDYYGCPLAKLHGLRMLDPRVFTAFPFASADSTNATRNGGIDKAWNGPYAPRQPWQRANVIADRIEAHQSAATWTGEIQECFGF